MSPLEHYQQALQHGFVNDPAQAQAVQALQQCFLALQQEQQCCGVYLWGPVGRGKTWLMDSFYKSLPVPAKRMHFHHFIAFLHQRLFQLSGQLNPLDIIAKELADEIKVLCFDELFVNDIGDAMLLGPLMQKLFAHGIVMIATSNEPPNKLYNDGFNRERFLPAIHALEENMQVIELDGKHDHRLHGELTQQRYFVKNSSSAPDFSQLFKQLSGETAQASTLCLNKRPLNYLGCHQDFLWCDYHNLCETHRSAMDYIELCQRFNTLLVSDVPNLNAAPKAQFIARGTEDAAKRVEAGDRKLMAISVMDNSVRRFIALVDECYEQNTVLYIEAEKPLDQLYTEGALLFPFRRTKSRLESMQHS